MTYLCLSLAPIREHLHRHMHYSLPVRPVRVIQPCRTRL